MNLVAHMKILIANEHPFLGVQPLLQTYRLSDPLRLPLHRQTIVIHVQLHKLVAAAHFIFTEIKINLCTHTFLI